jgi:hypothetical protein
MNLAKYMGMDIKKQLSKRLITHHAPEQVLTLCRIPKPFSSPLGTKPLSSTRRLVCTLTKVPRLPPLSKWAENIYCRQPRYCPTPVEKHALDRRLMSPLALKVLWRNITRLPSIKSDAPPTGR